MTRYLMLLLFIGTMGSRALGFDFGLAPGLSIKNALLYAVASAIAIESAIARNRKWELAPVILPFALLILYALMTWLITVLFLDRPYYSPVSAFIALKTKLVDSFLVLLVFFYGVLNWREALWLLKALIWLIVFGCLITVVDSYDVPDLGIITTRQVDGRVEGIIGSSQDFGALVAFALPAIIALWWTESGIKKKLVPIGIGLALVSIMLSASRGAMLGLVAGGLIAAFQLRRYISAQMLVRATLVALLFIAGTLLVVLSTTFGDLLETRLSTGIATGDLKTISSGRTAIWSAALRVMAEYPYSFITGLGWEAYFETIGYKYSTHSTYLDRLYNLGAIGLVLFVLSYTSAIATVRRSLLHAPQQAAPFLIAAIIGMISFIVALAFGDMPVAPIYVWACMGLALRVAVASATDTLVSSVR